MTISSGKKIEPSALTAFVSRLNPLFKSNIDRHIFGQTLTADKRRRAQILPKQIQALLCFCSGISALAKVMCSKYHSCRPDNRLYRAFARYN